MSQAPPRADSSPTATPKHRPFTNLPTTRAALRAAAVDVREKRRSAAPPISKRAMDSIYDFLVRPRRPARSNHAVQNGRGSGPRPASPRTSSVKRSSSKSADDPGESEPPDGGPTELEALAGARECPHPKCSDLIHEFNPATGRKTPSHKATCGSERCARWERRQRRKEEADSRNRSHRLKRQYVHERIGCSCSDRSSTGLPRSPRIDDDGFFRCWDCGRLATRNGKVVEASAAYLRRFDRVRVTGLGPPPLDPNTDLIELEVRRLTGADYWRTVRSANDIPTARLWLDRPNDEKATGIPRESKRTPFRQWVLEGLDPALRSFARSGYRNLTPERAAALCAHPRQRRDDGMFLNVDQLRQRREQRELDALDLELRAEDAALAESATEIELEDEALVRAAAEAHGEKVAV